MRGAFQLFKQSGYAFQRKSWPQPHGLSPHHKLLPWLGGLTRDQPQAQVVVDQFFERLPAAAHLLFQFGADIVIQGQSSSHIMMLAHEHHEHQRAPGGGVGQPFAPHDPELVHWYSIPPRWV